MTAGVRAHAKAHRSGRAAHEALRKVLRHLNSARSASTWDLFITDSIAHQRIENTRAKVVKAPEEVREIGDRLRARHAELSAESARLLARREELLRG